MVEQQPQLGDEGGHQPIAQRERQLVELGRVVRAAHRDPQPAPIEPQRNRLVLLCYLRRQQPDDLRRHREELRLGGHREPALLAQREPEGFDVQMIQLDQVGTQPAAVDHLRLQRLVELRLGDQALSNEQGSELLSHCPSSSQGRRIEVEGWVGGKGAWGAWRGVRVEVRGEVSRLGT